jgi:type III pantothenate kinase
VVVVAGDFERKGVPLAVRAIAQVPDATLIVAGAGDRAAMVALANDLGAGDRIEFLGHVDDLQSVYASADVVLSCSAHESFGLALVEGAASGCVVVSTDTGVAGSLCALDEQGKRAGVLVEPDAASVAAALRQLADSPASLMEMSHCAQIRAQGFSWQAMVEATVDLYREALKR